MVEKYLIGLAGEYAVASEICRRGMNAVVTLGNRKTVDIVVEDESLARLIQVKTKTGREWPGVKGVKGDNILILVDFQKRELTERARARGAGEDGDADQDTLTAAARQTDSPDHLNYP